VKTSFGRTAAGRKREASASPADVPASITPEEQALIDESNA
jgi:hypothetical protein